MPSRARAARVTRAPFALAIVLALVAIALPPVVPTVDAASPSPSIVAPGDTRSEGEGAGFVGSPVLVALAVVGLGVAVAGVTTIYLRLRSD